MSIDFNISSPDFQVFVDEEIARFRAECDAGLSTSHISPSFVSSPDEIIHTYVNSDGELVKIKDIRPRVEWVEVDLLVSSGEVDGMPLFEAVTVNYPIEHQAPNQFHEAEVIFYPTASLVTVKPDRTQVRDSRREHLRNTRSRARFSKGSRRRLMRTIAKTERQNRPLFVTLTYPDLFPDAPAKWKRDIDVLGKRFLRKFPGSAFVWRLEMLPRLSGEREGELAPHFHLLAWSVSYSSLREWLPSAWYEVVGSGVPEHLSAGTRVEYIRSWSGVMWYASKYISKVDTANVGDVGRWWGVVGRKNMPWGVSIRLALSALDAIKAIRLGRKMIGLSGKSLKYGLTWIVNGERFLDYLEFLEYFQG